MTFHLKAASSAILFFAVTTVASTCASAQGLPDEMPVPKADLMVRKANGILIDVRTPAEWAQTGVPATAHTLSMAEPDFVTRVGQITGGDKSRRIALICRSGPLSAQARETLRNAGYVNVTSIAGGISGPDGWIDADLPLRPYTD